VFAAPRALGIALRVAGLARGGSEGFALLRESAAALGEPGRKRLRCALALTLGTEALIAMKDSAGVDDDEEIVATLEWAAGALLRTALQDFEASP
jgi:hypothetical protein